MLMYVGGICPPYKTALVTSVHTNAGINLAQGDMQNM